MTQAYYTLLLWLSNKIHHIFMHYLLPLVPLQIDESTSLA